MHPLYANAGNERRDVPIITTRGDRSAHRDAVAVSRVSNLLADAGGTISLALEGVRNTWDVRHWWREYVVQTAFLVSVTLTPGLLIAIPIGATISPQIGKSTSKLGAESFPGAPCTFASLRQADPITARRATDGHGG